MPSNDITLLKIQKAGPPLASVMEDGSNFAPNEIDRAKPPGSRAGVRKKFFKRDESMDYDQVIFCCTGTTLRCG